MYYSYVDSKNTYRAWFDRFAINMRWCVSLFCNVRFFSFRTDARILLWYRSINSKFVQFRMNSRIGIGNAIFVNLGINDEDIRSLILKTMLLSDSQWPSYTVAIQWEYLFLLACAKSSIFFADNQSFWLLVISFQMSYE